jgi:hypothetical protein
VARFFLRNLGPGRGPLSVALVLAALACATWDGDARRRRATRTAVGLVVAAAVLGWLEAWLLVDDLRLEYLGVYLIAIPWVLVAVVAARVADEAAAARPAAVRGSALVLGAVAFVAVALAAPGWRDRYTGQPELPAARAALAERGALAPGRPLVIDFDPVSWTDALGLLVLVHRGHHRACFADPTWRYMVTGEFTCAPGELADGVAVRVVPGPQATVGGPGVLYAGPSMAVVAAPGAGAGPGPGPAGASG